jgi:hypothetical protein
MYMYCQENSRLDVHKWADMDMHVHRKPFRIKGDARRQRTYRFLP